MRLRLVDCCNIADAGVLTLEGAERMQRDLSENNVKQESMQCLAECRHPRERVRKKPLVPLF